MPDRSGPNHPTGGAPIHPCQPLPRRPEVADTHVERDREHSDRERDRQVVETHEETEDRQHTGGEPQPPARGEDRRQRRGVDETGGGMLDRPTPQ